jgi:tetratricopeptide (TPR) repeat protein
MIQVLFFLRFRTQLRRTRPNLTFQLEKAIIEALKAAGGKVEHKRGLITASFNEHALGIWLNISTLLEGLITLLDETASELYGYSLVIGEHLEEHELGWIVRNLAASSGGSSIWCTLSVQPLLSPYADFAESAKEPCEPLTPAPAPGASPQGYVQITHLGSPAKPDAEEDTPKNRESFSLRDKILQIIRYGATRNVVLVGPFFMGKREGLYRFCTEALGDLPPLIVRFGVRRSLGYLADALSPGIRSLMEGSVHPEVLEELDGLQRFLFRERLLDEYTGPLLQKGAVFLKKAVLAYSAMVQDRKRIPVLILEDLNNADETMSCLVMNVCKALGESDGLYIYGIYSYEAPAPEPQGLSAPLPKGTTAMEKINRDLRCWEGLFPKTLRFPPEYYPEPQIPQMPRDLWEVAYAVTLVRPYFPGALFPQLCTGEGCTAAMVMRAFTMLAKLQVIDIVEDPLPRVPRFTGLAEARLGERTAYVRAFVRNRVLAWVMQGKLRSCFGMLEILAALDRQGDEGLVLNAIYEDVINGTYQGIERAIAENRFEAVVDSSNGPILGYIFSTLKALLYGDAAEIQEAFTLPIPLETTFSGHKIHILLNLSSYYLGIKNVDLALDIVKEAMLIGQRYPQGITRVYRLFSLVNLAKHQLRDALDYIAFAVENAERLEQTDTLAVSAYYAASIQFLSGNLSRAEELALEAEQAALRAGQAEWQDRIRFLRGKLRFELGLYEEALDRFQSLQDKPVGPVSEEQERLIAVWIYRTLVYRGEQLQNPLFHGERVEPGLAFPTALGDAFLFEVEASYIGGDYQRTLSLTEQGPVQVSQEGFRYTERPDWRSGFCQCELLLLDPQDLWERLLLTYRGLALCRSPEANLEPVIEGIQQFLRNELPPDRDTNDIFYFYAYYRMLKESGAPEIDISNAVNMAFRRLQHRANRIEDLQTRQVFQMRPYWNHALSLAAKHHKLL